MESGTRGMREWYEMRLKGIGHCEEFRNLSWEKRETFESFPHLTCQSILLAPYPSDFLKFLALILYRRYIILVYPITLGVLFQCHFLCLLLKCCFSLSE